MGQAYVNGRHVNVTTENYLAIARERIAQLEAQRGTLSESEQLAVIDAMRQLAGMAPVAINVTGTGAARVNDPAMSGSFLLNLFNRLFDGTTELAKDAGQYWTEVSKDAANAANRPLGTIELVALAAGAYYVFKIVK